MAQTKEERRAKNLDYKEANKEALRLKNKAYREANKEKIAARKKAYREANKEKIAAKARAYHKANRDRICAKAAAWFEANKERALLSAKNYRGADKEKKSQADKAYREANKERVSSLKARYKALKLKQIPVHLRDCPHEKKRLVQIYKLRNILSEATGVQHHVDHMWPLSDGGPHWSGNLQVIPAEENLRKNASVCEETKATIIKSLYTFDTSSPI